MGPWESLDIMKGGSLAGKSGRMSTVGEPLSAAEIASRRAAAASQALESHGGQQLNTGTQSQDNGNGDL